MRKGEKGNGLEGHAGRGGGKEIQGSLQGKWEEGEDWIEGRRDLEGGGGSERREDHVTVFTSSQVVLHMGKFTPFLIVKR